MRIYSIQKSCKGRGLSKANKGLYGEYNVLKLDK